MSQIEARQRQNATRRIQQQATARKGSLAQRLVNWCEIARGRRPWLQEWTARDLAEAMILLDDEPLIEREFAAAELLAMLPAEGHAAIAELRADAGIQRRIRIDAQRVTRLEDLPI